MLHTEKMLAVKSSLTKQRTCPGTFGSLMKKRPATAATAKERDARELKTFTVDDKFRNQRHTFVALDRAVNRTN